MVQQGESAGEKEGRATPWNRFTGKMWVARERRSTQGVAWCSPNKEGPAGEALQKSKAAGTAGAGLAEVLRPEKGGVRSTEGGEVDRENTAVGSFSLFKSALMEMSARVPTSTRPSEPVGGKRTEMVVGFGE